MVKKTNVSKLKLIPERNLYKLFLPDVSVC